MIKTLFQSIWYSFPVRLLLLHLRSNLLVLSLWLVLIFVMTGVLGKNLGAQYLFLDPEYLGKVNFWSFFLLGLAFGGFLMTWNLTTYLTNAHHFPFLATLLRPFTKYCLNNIILPLLFFGFYLGLVIYFQAFFESWGALDIFLHCLGLLSGMATLVLLYFLYFHFTNRDISYYSQRGLLPPNLIGNIAPSRRDIDLEQMKLNDQRLRVDTYLTESLVPRLVRSVAHYDSRLLMRIFKQNHLNALVIQLVGMVFLVALGSLIDYPAFRIPAAASIFIMASIFIAVIGAIGYWFTEWRMTILILFLFLVNYITSFEVFNYRNPAYGLNYNLAPAPYSYQHLQSVFHSDQIARDKAATVAILDRWRQRVGSRGNKPKMVILSVSGGGLKSATWAMQVVQRMDSLLAGKLLDHTVLITGASGGMMGMAYLRELYLQKQQGQSIDLYDKQYIDNLSRDLLNSIAFTLVSNDLFIPWAKFETGGHVYRKDRGYIFERQFNENTGFLLDKPLAAYAEPEREALIPMLYLTPAIVNDGRRLIISPQGATFMMTPPIGVERLNAVEIDAVDFRWLLSKQNADNLRFPSAIRMNATYPYILPSVHLPTFPAIEVMDAGFRDNYGLLSATRFIQVFKDWILEHTSGVVLVQISSTEKIEDITPSDQKGIIESLFNPLGIPRQLTSLQEFEHDNSLGFLYDLLGGDHFHSIRFIFRPEEENKLRASVSFHITDREKQAVIGAIDEPDNQSSQRQLTRILSH